MGFAAYKILFNIWFYLGLMAAIIIINYFWGKPLVVAKQGKFFSKHEETIRKVADIVIVCIIIIFVLFLFYPIKMFLESLTIFNETQTSEHASKLSILLIDLYLLLINLIWFFGMVAFFTGLLSVFQKNITKTKRLILFIISILPLVFTISTLPIDPNENCLLTIQLVLDPLIICWLINGPAIILGQPWIKFWFSVMRKLRIVSGELAE